MLVLLAVASGSCDDLLTRHAHNMVSVAAHLL